jgi:hypothetical protein
MDGRGFEDEKEAEKNNNGNDVGIEKALPR